MRCKFEFGENYFRSQNYADYLEREPRYRNLAMELSATLSEIGCRRVLDFGCSVGFLVKHLNKLGFDCHGYDCSSWAVSYGRRLVTEKISAEESVVGLDWDAAIFLDVLEHNCREDALAILKSTSAAHIIVRIPVASREGGDFHLEVSRRDPTHILCLHKGGWRSLLSEAGFEEAATLTRQTIYDSPGVYCAVLRSRSKLI